MQRKQTPQNKDLIIIIQQLTAQYPIVKINLQDQNIAK